MDIPDISPQPSSTTVTVSDVFSLPRDDNTNEGGNQQQQQRTWLQRRDPPQHQHHYQHPHEQHQPLPLPPPQSSPPRKLLNVTVTILSMAGVHAKESGRKSRDYKSKFTRGGNKQQCQEDESSEFSSFASGDQIRSTPTTTVVASFERTTNDPNNASETIATHIPSVPLALPQSSFGRSKSTFSDVIYWPEQGEDTHSKLSSYTFGRYFPQEEEGLTSRKPRYVPQLCPIQIAISRNGKMFKLGSAHVFVSGEENGQTSLNVPVVNFETAFKTIRAGGSSSKTNLMRLKGDTVKCGLAERATLRLLVRVTDPLVPRIQMNYMRSSSESTKKIGTGNNQDDVVNTVASCNRSVATNDTSEASFEYDPTQRAVVLKKNGKQNEVHGGGRNNNNLSSPSVLSRKDVTRKEVSVFRHHPQHLPVADKKRNSLFDKNLSIPFFGNHHEENDEQSRTTATASTIGDRTSSSISSSSSASSHSTSHLNYNTDDCSLYSETSTELLKLIHDVAENRSNNDDTITMSTSVQSYQRKRGNSRKWADHGDDDEEYTRSTCSSGSSIATPPISARAMAAAAAAEAAHKNKPSTAAAVISNLTRKFTCCSGVSGMGNTTICDEDEWLMDSIHEDDVSLENDRYSLESREHSTLDASSYRKW